MMHEEKRGLKKRAVNELRKLSIAVIYLWVFLSVFTLHREIILRSYHINYSAKFGFALLNAVILAKFMWLGEILHAEKKAARKALIYVTLWNAALFAVILMICHLLEEALVKIWHGHSFVASFLPVPLGWFPHLRYFPSRSAPCCIRVFGRTPFRLGIYSNPGNSAEVPSGSIAWNRLSLGRPLRNFR